MKEESYMAWNEPGSGRGGNDQQPPPWGSRNRDPGPPDLEQWLKRLFEKFKKLFNFPLGVKFKGGSGSGSGSSYEAKEMQLLTGLVLAAALVLYLLSGIYIVDPPERAVVTRFGKYVRTEGPGPHWILPLIESREIVNVEQVATSDHQGLMLTRDRNIASVGIAVQYRIGEDVEDVRAYLFNVANPIHSLKMSAESALRQVLGQSTMDEVLTLKRAEIALAIKEQLIETLKNYKTGIAVIDVTMQFAKAPDEVRAAFDDVIKAAADEERLVNQAHAYENEVLPKARGIAGQLKNEAEGYKQETILVAEGNVKRFNSILPHYQKFPKVTQTRLYLDALEGILSRTSKVVIDGNLGNNLIYLPFDKMISPTELATVASGTEEANSSSANYKEKAP